MKGSVICQMLILPYNDNEGQHVIFADLNYEILPPFSINAFSFTYIRKALPYWLLEIRRGLGGGGEESIKA